MMIHSVMNLQHRLVLELSAGLSFDKGRRNRRVIYVGGNYKLADH
jgi:hypothetical protein